MRKEEIIIMLGTAHLDEILGKCSPDGTLRECVYSREIIADVKAKLESYGYKVFVDYEPLKKSDKMTGSGTLQSRELEYRVKVVNSPCQCRWFRWKMARRWRLVLLHVKGQDKGRQFGRVHVRRGLFQLEGICQADGRGQASR